MTQQAVYTGADINLAGMVFNTVDESNCTWILNDLDGWWGLPEATLPDDPQPFTEDGSYYAAGRYGPRIITLTAQIIPGAGGSMSAVYARNSLQRAVNLVRHVGILRVDEPGTPKQALVQLMGRPITRMSKLSNVVDVNIQLRAADPRKYSVLENSPSVALPESSGGRTYNKTFNYTYGTSGSTGLITVYNEGSYNTFGSARIYGPVINPSIEHIESGAVLTFNITLNTGDYLDVDLRTKTVTLNDSVSRRTSLHPMSQWFKILPGTSTLRFNGVKPDPLSPDVATMHFTYRSAWIE